MSDDKTQQGASAAAPGSIVTPATIAQFRQLSIPLAARIAAVMLAVAVLALGGWLVVDGWQHCTANCKDKALENGSKILAAAILPSVVIVYLAFAETGVRALLRKIDELLDRMVPEALRQERKTDFVATGEIEECQVETHFSKGSSRARYRLTAKRGDRSAVMNILLELNVAKVNTVFLIPVPTGTTDDLRNRLKETIAGATHEGYSFDEAWPIVEIDGGRYIRLVARKRLPDNFLWDPGLKLHFAQDLRMFAHAVISDGWDLLELV